MRHINLKSCQNTSGEYLEVENFDYKKFDNIIVWRKYCLKKKKSLKISTAKVSL